jgi:hypothetical protein
MRAIGNGEVMGKLAIIGQAAPAVAQVPTPARKAMQRANHSTTAARETIEAHDAIAALDAVMNRLRMRQHDLASEMIARKAKLEAEALNEARSLTGD